MGVDAELYIRVPGKLSHQALRKISVDLVIAFGAHPFFLSRPEDNWLGAKDYPNGRHALSIANKKDHYLAIEEGSTLVECHLSGRYYGPGYERGDIVSILGIAKWLRARFDKDLRERDERTAAGFAQCTLYYGGDSSSSLDVLDDKLEAELWDHFCSKDSRNYFTKGWNPSGTTMPPCNFCKIDMVSSGGGGACVYVHCNGCGARYAMNANTGKLKVRADDFGGPARTTDEKVIPRHELDEFLYQAVAAASIKETEIEEARSISWGDDVRAGRSMRLHITTPWHLLSPDQRHQAYEAASVKLAELAKKELEAEPHKQGGS